MSHSWWRRCAAQIHEWMVLKWSKLQRISPAQGVGSNGHCVVSLSMSIGTKRTSNEQIIWIRCVNKERHAEYAGGDGGGWVFGEDWNWEPLGISFFKIYFLCFYYICFQFKLYFKFMFSVFSVFHVDCITVAMCICKNLAILYVSWYRGCNTIYCDTVSKVIYWDISYFRNRNLFFRESVTKSTPLQVHLNKFEYH